MSAPEKMSEDDFLKLYTTATGKRLPNMGPTRQELYKIARAIETARDAQWQARLDAAIAAEQQRICAVIQAYPEWIGRTAKEDLCMAIMRDAG